MDPFDTLYNATTPLLGQLNLTSAQSLDFMTLQNEILQSISDLDESIKIVETNLISHRHDSQFGNITIDEIRHRKNKVKDLSQQLNNILVSKNVSSLKGSYGINPFGEASISTTKPYKDKEDAEGLDNATREYHQQLLQEQDDIISNELTNSIQNLHNQAVSIGNELDYQNELINDVNSNMERLNFKIVNNGMKRINHFLETNEMGGNCCILLLIVILVFILILLIIA